MTVLRHLKPLWTQRLQGFPEAVVLFNSGGNLAVGSTDGDVVCFEVTSGKRLWSSEGHPEGLTSMASLPGGNGFLSGGEDGVLRAWSGESTKSNWSCDIGQGWVDCISVSPSGQIVIASGPRLLLIGSEGQILEEWAVESRVGFLLFTSDNSRLITVNAKSIVIFSLPERERLREVPFETTPLSAALSKDDVHMAVGLSDRSVRFLRLIHESDEAAGMGPFRAKPLCLGWSHSPSRLLFTDVGRAFMALAEDLDGFLQADSTEERDFESSIQVLPAPYGKPQALSVHPNGEAYALGSDEGQLMIASLYDSSILAELELRPGGVQHLHWLANGTDLLYVMDGGSVGVLRIPFDQ